MCEGDTLWLGFVLRFSVAKAPPAVSVPPTRRRGRWRHAVSFHDALPRAAPDPGQHRDYPDVGTLTTAGKRALAGPSGSVLRRGGSPAGSWPGHRPGCAFRSRGVGVKRGPHVVSSRGGQGLIDALPILSCLTTVLVGDRLCGNSTLRIPPPGTAFSNSHRFGSGGSRSTGSQGPRAASSYSDLNLRQYSIRADILFQFESVFFSDLSSSCGKLFRSKSIQRNNSCSDFTNHSTPLPQGTNTSCAARVRHQRDWRPIPAYAPCDQLDQRGLVRRILRRSEHVRVDEPARRSCLSSKQAGDRRCTSPGCALLSGSPSLRRLRLPMLLFNSPRRTVEIFYLRVVTGSGEVSGYRRKQT